MLPIPPNPYRRMSTNYGVLDSLEKVYSEEKIWGGAGCLFWMNALNNRQFFGFAREVVTS